MLFFGLYIPIFKLCQHFMSGHINLYGDDGDAVVVKGINVGARHFRFEVAVFACQPEVFFSGGVVAADDFFHPSTGCLAADFEVGDVAFRNIDIKAYAGWHPVGGYSPEYPRNPAGGTGEISIRGMTAQREAD